MATLAVRLDPIIGACAGDGGRSVQCTSVSLKLMKFTFLYITSYLPAIYQMVSDDTTKIYVILGTWYLTLKEGNFLRVP